MARFGRILLGCRLNLRGGGEDGVNPKLNNLGGIIGITLSLAVLGTFMLTLAFWQAGAKAAATAPIPELAGKAGVENGREESMEIKKQLLEEQRAKAAAEEEALNKKFKDLENRIREFLQKQPGTYGFSLYTQREAGGSQIPLNIGYNQNESFKMASTFKVPVNLYLYQQVAEKKLSLDEKLVYSAKFYESGTGSLQYKKPGGSYSLRQLASLSIRESDNVAVNMLLAKLGKEKVINFMKQLGGTGGPVEGTPYATPADLAIYMKGVYDFAQFKPEYGNYLIKDLENTVFQSRIRQGTPANVVVAHKIGNLGGVVNDVGIVYAHHPYILAIMSKNVDEDKGEETLAQVAKMVWESIGQD